MDSEELIFRNFMKNMAVITLRKLDFAKIFIIMLSEEIGKQEAEENTPKIIEIVGSLDYMLFLSEMENKVKQIIVGTKIDDLDRKKIGEIISEKLHL